MIDTPNRTELSALAEDDARMHHASDEDMMQIEPGASIVAPGMHDAQMVHADLAPYSLTREQVSQKYKDAGFVVKPRTVSLYAKEGRLRAVKVEAKNGLERYVFDAASVDEDIARRRSYDQPDALYVGVANGADRVQEDGASISHDAKSEQGVHAPGMHARIDQKDITIAKLETALEFEQGERKKVEQKLADETNRSMNFARKIGEYETKIDHLQNRLALIEGPKAEPEPEPMAADGEVSVSEPQPIEPTPTSDTAKPPSFLARMFRRR